MHIMDIKPFINWIESHPITVDLVKWIAIIVIAWATGVFRFISSFIKKPIIEIISDASHVFIERLEDGEGLDHVVRATFIIDLDVVNPTNDKVHVRYFRLRFSRNKLLGLFSKEMHAISLPARPRTKMGESYKVSKVFFTYFNDGLDNLTATGELEPKETQNAFLLFNSTTYGDWEPKVKKGKVRVEIRAKLSTGELLKSKHRVRVTEDREFMEEWIPGIFEHVAGSGARNTYVNRGE